MNNDEMREKIAKQTAEYLAKGGKIIPLPGPAEPDHKGRADTRSTLDGRG